MSVSVYKELMRQLDEAALARYPADVIYMAREDFPLSSNTASGFQDMIWILTSFVIFVDKRYRNSEDDMPPEQAHALVQKLLRRDFESLYPQAVLGIDGGLSRLLNDLTDQLVRQAISDRVEHILDSAINNPNDYATLEEIMLEYRRDNKAALEAMGIPIRSTEMLAKNWREILRNHCLLIGKHRNLVGQF